MRPMIIGPKEVKALIRLEKHAEANRIDVDEVLDIYNKQAPPVGDRGGFDCEIPVGYRVVFCIEAQKQGWARHLSVSLYPRNRGKSANPVAVAQIMVYLGFKNFMPSKELDIWLEDENTIVNIIEYLDGKKQIQASDAPSPEKK